MRLRSTISVFATLAALTYAGAGLAQGVNLDASGGVGVDVQAGDNNNADNSNGGANVGVDAGGGVNLNNNQDAGAAGGNVGVDAGVNTQLQSQGNLTFGNDAGMTGERISTMSDTNAQGEAIARLSGADRSSYFSSSSTIDASNVSIVDVEDRLGAEGSASLMSRLAANQEDLDGLRGDVRSNADLTAVLERNNVSPDDVVGVQTNADGSTDVFVADGQANIDCNVAGAGNVSLSADTDASAISNAEGAVVSVLTNCDVASVSVSDQLRSSISSNSDISSRLQARGFAAEDGVGVTSLGDSMVHIYVEAE